MSSIIAPVLTEKSTMAIDTGLYVFAVSEAANTQTIRQELKALYKVDPLRIRIVNLPAKKVNFKRKPGVRSIRRKAYVQLPPKQVIPGFETLLKKDEKSKDKTETKKETK